jgi:hypothetical protein
VPCHGGLKIRVHPDKIRNPGDSEGTEPSRFRPATRPASGFFRKNENGRVKCRKRGGSGRDFTRTFSILPVASASAAWIYFFCFENLPLGFCTEHRGARAGGGGFCLVWDSQAVPHASSAMRFSECDVAKILFRGCCVAAASRQRLGRAHGSAVHPWVRARAV